MPRTSIAQGRQTDKSEKPGNLRGYRRRKLPVPVVVIDVSGDVVSGTATDFGLGGLAFVTPGSLSTGSDGIANLELPTDAKLKTAVRVVWERPHNGAHLYGLRFGEVNGEERGAVLDALHARVHGEAGALFDSEEPSADRASVRSSKQLPEPHHAYYLRLVRRLANVKSLSAAQVDNLLFAVLQQGRDFVQTLLDLKLTSYDKLDDYLSSIYEVPYVNLSAINPDPSVAELIPETFAQMQKVVPVKRVEGKYIVAMADPLDLPSRDVILSRSKHQAEFRFSLIGDVEKAIKSIYQAASLNAADRLISSASSDRGIEVFSAEPEVTDLETLRKLSDATPIISLVDSLLRTAVEERASDIHLDPMGDAILVHFRLDGVLHEMRTLPRNLLQSVVSRIKIMAGMDITERHIPQDGRISMRYGGKDFELRVCSLPTVYGEKVVVRLLEKNPVYTTMRSIGFSERNYDLFAPLIRRPYGMILFCGPTGSGKSTTLFSCIQEVHDGTKNIVTVEDPVEYRVRGVNHMELNPRRGVTFPTVLRSILRSDPDVIYVGEIRDRETADLAVRAALTGHLLFSTLHTNTAIQAITRLVDIGVDPPLIGASLIGVIGQRLLRRVCDWCKESYEISQSERDVLRDTLEVATPPTTLQRGRGCAHCHKTGYYGRLAVHELVVVDEGLRHLIGTGGADSGGIKTYVEQSGFQDLRADAVDRLLRGDTTLQEVIRVTV